MVETSINGIVGRMVRLPRSILGGFSRVVNQGIDLMGIGGRRRNQYQPSNFPPPPEPLMMMIQEEWAFLSNFEQQFGTIHPFFYACRFIEALKMAQEEHKFVFLYLHSPEHPFTPTFCRETLCSEVVVQFVDANFVSWGALANRGEGLHMATTLSPASFPFCAILAPAPGDSLAVLQQMEGPVSPAELVEILQRTMEEQGLAFGGAVRAREEERRRVVDQDQRLREEQDAAYVEALQKDQDKELFMNLGLEKRGQKQVEASNNVNHQHPKTTPTKKQDGDGKVKRATTIPQAPSNDRDAPQTRILIRFPNGERREKSFFCRDKILAIYRYIDSLGLPGVGNYKLISSFPRKVYGVDQMLITLKDAGLHPKATLFLELV